MRAIAGTHLELRHLRYFVAVAEAGSLSRAAARLHISQPPLTRQIRHLEEVLGTRLLLRKARGIELTDAGRALREEARNILSLAGQALERVVLIGEGRIGRIDIGIFGSAIFGVIPRLIADFRAAHPAVFVALHHMDRAEQVRALRDRRISLGFNRFLAAEGDIAAEVVLTERLHLACAADHPLARQRPVRIRDLRGQPLIVYPRAPRPGFADKVIALCQGGGFEAQVVQEVEDVVTALALVSCGLGICLVPQSAVNLTLPGVVYRRLERSGEATVDLHCLYLREEPSPMLESFLAVVRAFAARQRD